MAAVSGTIPNLIGGVSQQPAEIRSLNTSTALSNTWSDVATGLSSRPCGRYVNTVSAAPFGGDTVATHVINKPSGRFQISVHGGSIYVTDLSAGVTQTVIVDSGGAYLTTADAARNIGFVTVGDTTFIYNRSVIIAKSILWDGIGLDGITEESVVRKNPNLNSTIWVRQMAGYDTDYHVFRNGFWVANHWAPSNSNVSAITSGLRSQLDGVSGMTAVLASSTVISLTHDTAGYRITTEDGYGNQAMWSYDASIKEFTDLPNNDIEGRLVLVKHSPEDQSDDYWVWRKGGYWEETYGWNAKEQLTVSTMPVILVDNKNGTWTLKETAWGGRDVGDDKSNPTPTFVGRAINHMFIHKNRMCILSDENFITSRVGEFEQFYRRTCTQLLDDEPIDIAAPEGAGGPLYHAREFDRGLLLFSEFDQFKIESDSEGLLSPNTVGIKHANSYNCSSKTSPVYIGPDLLFVDDFGPTGYATLREYQIERVFGREVALPITDQVPEYIPSGVYKMVSSSTDSVVAVLSSANRRKAWIYNYYFNSEGKVQSAWQEWTFPGNVMSCEFHGDRLMVTLVFSGSLCVLEYQFHSGAAAGLTVDDVLLDFRMEQTHVSIAMDGDDTVVTTPFSLVGDDADHIRLVVSPENTGSAIKGRVFKPDSVSGTILRFNGVNLTGNQLFVGVSYLMSWTLSPIYMRDNNLVAIQDGRLQLRKISILYNDSGPFEATYTPTGGRDSYVSVFSGWIVGSDTTILNELRMNSGEFRISVNGAAETMVLTVTARTPWRVRFSSVEWDGRWRAKKRRTT